VLAHTVDGARQSSDLIINTFDAIEATDLSKIREHLSIPVFNL
jgi:UDP-glucosyltransferase BX9